MFRHGTGSGLRETISYYTGRFDILVGFLSLAFASFLAGLYARKTASRELTAWATTVLAASSIAMMLPGKRRKGEN